MTDNKSIKKIIFMGEFDKSDVVPSTIKVSKAIFNQMKIASYCSFVCYFQDGTKYSYFQKLFGYQLEEEKVFRMGLFPLFYFIIKNKPNVLHLFSLHAYYLPILVLANLLDIKVVYSVQYFARYEAKNFLRCSRKEYFRISLIEYLVFNLSNLLLVSTTRSIRFLQIYYKIETSKIRKIPLGVNLKEYITPKKYKIKTLKNFFMVGDINRVQKGFDFLIKSLNLFDFDCNLKIYNSSNQNSTSMLLKLNSDSHAILFEKALNEEEFLFSISNEDLCIVPSRNDTFNLSLLEAMSLGLLFITSSRVGLVDYFPHEFQPLVLRYGHTSDLLNKVRFLNNLSIEEKNVLSQQIKNFATKFEWSHICQKLLTIY